MTLDTGHRTPDTCHLHTLNFFPQVLDNIPGKSRTMLHLIKVFRGQADQTIKNILPKPVTGSQVLPSILNTDNTPS